MNDQQRFCRDLMAASFSCLDRGDGCWREEDGACWFEAPFPRPFANFVISAGDRPQRRTVQRVADRFQQRGMPCCWFVWSDQQPEIVQALLAELGFRTAAPASLLSAPTALLLAATPNPGQRVGGAVAGARLIALDQSWQRGYLHCLEDCFAIPAGLGAMAAEAYLGRQGPQDPRTYGVVRDDDVLAVATVVVREGRSCLSWVGTASAWRRRGLGRAVTAAAVATGAALGGRTTLLQAMADAVPLYRRMGFGVDGVVKVFFRNP